MEKSIESIWKKGFANESAATPKVKDFDRLQSIYFIDQFKSRYTTNVIVLMATAVLVLLAFIFGGIPWIGIFMFSLFFALALLGRQEINKLEQLNHGANNYEYIQSFDNWLKNLLSKFALIYRIWVPLLFIGFALAILQTNLFVPFLGETLIEKWSDPSSQRTILGMPIFWIFGIVSVATLLSFLSNYLFKLEMKSIYGDLINKLDQLLVDLRELR